MGVWRGKFKKLLLMSLDTVLKIGSALRNAKDSLKYFKYVSPCPKDKDGNFPLCVSIPVSEDFQFDWNNIKEVPENQKNKLYYLRFKTSDSDGLMKYIFGDIYYSKTATINKKNGNIETSENGGYRLADPNHSNAAYRPGSFIRGNMDFQHIINGIDNNKSILLKFRNALSKDLPILETILASISSVEYFLQNPLEIDFCTFIKDQNLIKEYTIKQLIEKTNKTTLKKLGIDPDNSLNENQRKKLIEYDNGVIFIHFEFPEGKNWYDFSEDFNLINQKILSDFVDKSSNGLVLKKTLYKTLCSGDKKNDIQFPNFRLDAKYKSKTFSDESIQDLFYSVDYSKKGTLIPGTDIKIIILPRGENLTSEDYINFQLSGDEEQILHANSDEQKNKGEPLFDIFEEFKNDNITSFDVIFSKKGGATSPDVDLSEISGLEKSNIRKTKQRIADIANYIYQNRKKYFRNTTKDFYGFTISSSFRNILGSPQSDTKTGKVSFKSNPTYQSHLLKVLPLIYTDNYYFDPDLLDSFIQNIEFSIRSGDSKFIFLKFDLEFLFSIQNNKNNKYMDIINSESYQLGNLLGTLAKNFAGENSPIKSFEKNYVGNLSRRITTLDDFVKLKNDIEQKLIMHEKTNFTFKTSYELSQKVKEFNGIYDKEECAFGFLEAYFKPISKKENSNIETES